MSYTSFLQTLINMKRQSMIQIAMEQGLTSNEVLKCSQELDILLNLYMEISYQ